jgi:hypothetical protein
VLQRIAESRNDDAEREVAGKSIEDLDRNQWPCCLEERGGFMAKFEYDRIAEHPYRFSSPKTHGHFDSTTLRYPPYCAAAIPFRWMFSETLTDFRDEYELNIDPEWEPQLGFPTAWVQDERNQRALLDCFFDHLRPKRSLIFLYAKRVPFAEQGGRVLIGVGRVNHVGGVNEYRYSAKGKHRSILWERMIQHSIRPDFKDAEEKGTGAFFP